jgi:hypothetical protein
MRLKLDELINWNSDYTIIDQFELDLNSSRLFVSAKLVVLLEITIDGMPKYKIDWAFYSLTHLCASSAQVVSPVALTTRFNYNKLIKPNQLQQTSKSPCD